VGGKKKKKKKKKNKRPIYLDSGTVPFLPNASRYNFDKRRIFFFFFFLSFFLSLSSFFYTFLRPFFPSDAKKEEKEKW
jgi:hypothetical protein